MSINVTLPNGITYPIPEYNDKGWAQGTSNLTSYLVAVATAINGGGGGGQALIDIVSVTGTSQSVTTGKTYLVATASHAVSMNMPTPSANAWFWVKDVSGNAAVHNITLVRHGSEKINGVASNKVLSISAGEWLFACDGTDWYMLRDAEALNPLKSSNQLIFTPGAFTTTLNVTAPSAARVITLPDPGTAAAIILSQGTQTITGDTTIDGNAHVTGVATLDAVPVFPSGIGSTFLGSSGTQGVLDFYAPTAGRGRGRLKISDSSGSNLDSIVTIQVIGSTNVDQTVNIPANATELVGTTAVQTISGTKTMTSLQFGANVVANSHKITGLAAGTVSGDSVRYEQITGFLPTLTGAGSLWFTSSIPSGYLSLDGSNVSRTTYADLFSLWGTAFGVGDGTTTFGLPDMRRRVPMGAGGSGTGTIGNAVGNTGGEENHTLTTPEIPSHNHVQTGDIGAVFNTLGTGANSVLAASGTSNTANTGGGGAHNTIQPSFIVYFIVKT